jgi:hypothetical protein
MLALQTNAVARTLPNECGHHTRSGPQSGISANRRRAKAPIRGRSVRAAVTLGYLHRTHRRWDDHHLHPPPRHEQDGLGHAPAARPPAWRTPQKRIMTATTDDRADGKATTSTPSTPKRTAPPAAVTGGRPTGYNSRATAT